MLAGYQELLQTAPAQSLSPGPSRAGLLGSKICREAAFSLPVLELGPGEFASFIQVTSFR